MHSKVCCKADFPTICIYVFIIVVQKLSYQAPGKYKVLKLIKKTIMVLLYLVLVNCDSHFLLFTANKGPRNQIKNKKGVLIYLADIRALSKILNILELLVESCESWVCETIEVFVIGTQIWQIPILRVSMKILRNYIIWMAMRAVIALVLSHMGQFPKSGPDYQPVKFIKNFCV